MSSVRKYLLNRFLAHIKPLLLGFYTTNLTHTFRNSYEIFIAIYPSPNAIMTTRAVYKPLGRRYKKCEPKFAHWYVYSICS